jgi:hypothetical protein
MGLPVLPLIVNTIVSSVYPDYTLATISTIFNTLSGTQLLIQSIILSYQLNVKDSNVVIVYLQSGLLIKKYSGLEPLLINKACFNYSLVTITLYSHNIVTYLSNLAHKRDTYLTFSN